MGGQRTLIRLGIAAAMFMLFILHIGGVLRLSFAEQIERITYDARILLTMPKTVDRQVVIIDVDEKSITAEGHWPWSRDKFALLAAQATGPYKVRSLGFDIFFPEADTAGSGVDTLKRLAAGELADLPGFAERVTAVLPSLDYEARFAEAIKGKPVVLGYVLRQQGQKDVTDQLGALAAPVMDANTAKLYDIPFMKNSSYTGNLPVLQAAAASGGNFDNSQALDDDGVFRRVPLVQMHGGSLYPALSLETLRVALGAPPIEFEFDPADRRSSAYLEALRIGPVRVPVDERVQAYVPFRGRTPSFTYISATDIMRGTAAMDVLAGKVALVGTSAPGLKDLRVTPVGAADPGVEVHANLISGMLDGRVKQKAPYYNGIHAMLLLVIASVLGFGASRLAPLANGALALGLIAGITGLAMALWSYGNFIIPLGTPILFSALLFLLLTFYGYFIESANVRQVSKQFGEYIPPEMVEMLASNPALASEEGDKRNMTVLFSDVRGFTTISEKLDSKELTKLMNQFLTPLTRVIREHRGTVDKYMGDAIMAFWGAPIPDENHATNALLAGMAMTKVVRDLDADFEAKGWPKLYIGVGLNSGDMTVGNMGSEYRRAYTVLGDAVNLGSRLEGLTKEYGVYFIVSEATRNAGPKDWAYRELDFVKVKGKNEPVAIYEPLGPKDAIDPALRNDLARHRGAMKLYRSQLWDQAEVELANLSLSGRPHKIYDIFLERIQYLREHPPGAKWDGSFTATHK
ncbi:MAG: adenylate/guanylate cyclase domain-containing protein [Pseudomonadota bacterium]